MGNFGRLVPGAIMVALAALPTSAKHRPATPPLPTAPAHNFVSLDLTVSVPGAPMLFRAPVYLLDSTTTARSGDTVSFDVLTIAKTSGRYVSGTHDDGPPDGTIIHDVTSYAVSCNWRTIRLVAQGPLLYGAGERFEISPSSFNTQNSFLDPRSPYLVVIDQLCAGGHVNAAKGFGSADAAVMAWTTAFAAPPTTPVAPPAPRVVARANLLPLGTDGLDGTRPQRFMRIEQDGVTGNVRYLDRGTLMREGQGVTALSFSLLGPQAQYWSNESVGVLQKIHYACDTHTMMVLGQSAFDRFQSLIGTTEKAFGPRSADAASQIEAACAEQSDGAGLSSVDAIWAEMRSQWPPNPLLGWAACLWNNLPAGRRQSFTDHWTGDPNDRFVVQQSEVSAIFTGCAVPSAFHQDALNRVSMYATQRAALERLSARKLDEATLLSAWRAISPPDKLRVIRAGHTLNMDDIKFELDIGRKLAKNLGLASSDAEGLNWVRSYIMDQAFLEGS